MMVRFQPYSDADLALTVALETDAAVKRNLGGPLTRDEAARVHQRRLDGMARGDLFYTVTVDGEPEPVGIAGIFETRWEGGTVFEAGIMLRPGFRTRGVGLEALRMLTELARTEKGLRELHGFTALSNHAANTMGRKFGFELVGECDLDYEGQPLRCNHWVYHLA